MSALVWLTIPVGALLLALVWVAWATRTRPRADTHDTVAAHRRFRAAFERAPARGHARAAARRGRAPAGAAQGQRLSGVRSQRPDRFVS